MWHWRPVSTLLNKEQCKITLNSSLCMCSSTLVPWDANNEFPSWHQYFANHHYSPQFSIFRTLETSLLIVPLLITSFILCTAELYVMTSGSLIILQFAERWLLVAQYSIRTATMSDGHRGPWVSSRFRRYFAKWIPSFYFYRILANFIFIPIIWSRICTKHSKCLIH